MTTALTVGALDSCDVSHDGQVIRVGLSGESGEPVKLCLSPDQAGSLAMTLPRLVSAALKARYDDPSLRMVFPLATYHLEEAPGRRDLILSLKTTDGFEVSFCVPPEALRSLADLAANHAPEPLH